jgi:putative peptide zinc metalloprotease protein
VLFPGIAGPSRWLDRWLVPVILSLPGRVLIALVVIAGGAAFFVGRPELPSVSEHPAIEGLLGLALGLALTVCHELAHGVALVHYGKAPTRAGFGFYWGALCFYVDSTPVLMLERRQRVIQALAGLGVDVVTLSLCAVLAHLVDSTLVAIVFWRIAVLSLIEVAVNAAPVLEVDGHWALADLLDEPDLSSRSRRALGQWLHGRWAGERWLPAYGAVSMVTGIGLLGAVLVVFWESTGQLVTALFQGDAADIAIGLYYVVPLLLGVAASTLGLLLETLAPGPGHEDS